MGYWSGHYLNAKMSSDAKVQLHVKVWPVICMSNFKTFKTCQMLSPGKWYWCSTYGWTHDEQTYVFQYTSHITIALVTKKSSLSSHSTGGGWGYIGFILCIHPSVHPYVCPSVCRLLELMELPQWSCHLIHTILSTLKVQLDWEMFLLYSGPNRVCRWLFHTFLYMIGER